VRVRTGRHHTGDPVVGRSAAKRTTHGWLRLAASGAPRVGIFRGDAGSGRSTLLRSTVEDAEDHGFTVLRATPPTRDGPPLLPVITMLGPLLEQVRADRRDDLDAADRHALDLLVHGSAAPPAAPGAPTAEDTARLLAVSRLVLGIARTRPLLLAVDEAQELDPPSAELLAHLVGAAAHEAELVPIHLLTLVTVRRAEPGANGDAAPERGDRRRAPAGSPDRRRAAALRRLATEEGAAVLEVDGLDELGLNELLTLHGPAPPSRPILSTMLRRTGGNPALALDVWRSILAADDTAVVGGVVDADPSLVERVPIGRDEALDERLGRLPPACRSLLVHAAALGVRGRMDALAAVAGCTIDEAEELVDAAGRAGICRLDEDHYQFEDATAPAAMIRQELPSRRRRLHGRVAAALASLPDPPATTIAAHLRLAGDPDPDACRRWGLAAALDALASGSWGEAASGFELALDRGQAGVDDARLRLGLLLQAATAFALDHDQVGCERCSQEAIDLARTLGDLESWCEALAEVTHSRIRMTVGGTRLGTGALDELLGALADGAPALRARILALRAEIRYIAFDYETGRRDADEACRLAEVAGDDDLIAFVRFADGLQHKGRLDLDASERSFRLSIDHADRTPDCPAGMWARARLPSAHWLRAELAAAEAASEAAEQAAADAQDWAELSLVSAWRANIAGAAGRFADAELLAERALVRHRRSDYAFTPIVAYPALVIARAVRGDDGGAHAALDTWRAAGATRFADRLEILVDCLAAEPGPGADLLAGRAWRPVGEGALDLRRAGALLAQIEIAGAIGDDELLLASSAVFDLHSRGVRFVPGSLSLVSRLCAAVATATDPRRALRWIAVARREADEAGAAAERARCDLDEAAIRRRLDGSGDGDGVSIDQLLVRASAAFDRLDLLPFVRLAQHRLGGHAPPASRAAKVILFTDLVESTSLNVAAGDDAYVELLGAHDRIVRELLLRHAGVEFKHTGDGIAAWFASATHAVDCALALHDRLAGLLLADTGVAVRSRCGLAAGRPIAAGSDLFGLAVATAARICAAAPPGGVLVTDEVATLARTSASFEPIGALALKGLPDPVPLQRAHPIGARGSTRSTTSLKVVDAG
jgi:class 3 adenylate cyclase